jgi:hypothetical protein
MDLWFCYSCSYQTEDICPHLYLINIRSAFIFTNITSTPSDTTKSVSTLIPPKVSQHCQNLDVIFTILRVFDTVQIFMWESINYTFLAWIIMTYFNFNPIPHQYSYRTRTNVCWNIEPGWWYHFLAERETFRWIGLP